MGKKAVVKLPKKVTRQEEDQQNDVTEIIEEYEVERIVKKRINKDGSPEYFLKWKGYAEKDNSWEPLHHIMDLEMVAKFEANLFSSKKQGQEEGQKSRKRNSPSASSTSSSLTGSGTISQQNNCIENKVNNEKKIKEEKDSKKFGFDRGLEPEEILGITPNPFDDKHNGQGHMFLMKWKDHDEADLIQHEEANIKCPQLVIKFFEERLIWQNVPFS